MTNITFPLRGQPVQMSVQTYRFSSLVAVPLQRRNGEKSSQSRDGSA